MIPRLISFTLMLVASPTASHTIDQSAQPQKPRSAAAAKILAEERGETPEVQALLKGSDPNARDKPRGRTALMWAIAFNDKAAFDRFLASGADVNAVDDQGETPLLHAAQFAMKFDTTAMVEALIANGADVAPKVPSMQPTALMLAANANAPGVAKAILSKLDPSAVDAINADGQTALIIAASVGARDVAWLLLEKGAKIDGYDADGKTPLIHAAGRRSPGTVDTVKLLLEMGANPAAKDRNGNTPLSEARKRENPEVVALLQKAGGL